MKAIIKKLIKASGIYPLLHSVYRKYLERKEEKEFLVRRKVIMANYNNNYKCINIGGGNFLKRDWRVLDYVSSQYAYNMDLIDFNINLLENTPWPIETSSYDLAYSSHCLEHLTNEAGINVFREVHRILKTGGIFRLTLPDIDLAYNAYKNNDFVFFKENVNAKDTSSIMSYFLDFFTNISTAGIDSNKFDQDFSSLSKEGFLDRYIPAQIEMGTHDFSKHINWYNEKKIKEFADKAGFSDVVLSRRGYSISEEMRTPQFDHKPGAYCIYMDIIK